MARNCFGRICRSLCPHGRMTLDAQVVTRPMAQLMGANNVLGQTQVWPGKCKWIAFTIMTESPATEALKSCDKRSQWTAHSCKANNVSTFYSIWRIVAAFACDRVICSDKKVRLLMKAHSTPSFHDMSTLYPACRDTAFFNSRRTVPRIWGVMGSGVS